MVACRAFAGDSEAVPSVEECDKAVHDLEEMAKKMVAGAAAGIVFTGAMADSADAYPIFAQQNYAQPREATGKIACANCHLKYKPIDVKLPHDVLPDTIFKATIEIPAKYEKRMQPIASGDKAAMNVGAIAVFPEGWKLAPKDRLPKALKKEMKGLAWSPYSKEKPNIWVAGPVPGKIYGEKMVLPILAPDPNTQPNMHFIKETVYFGGNRGRGQVYPEGNQSNNNQFNTPAVGTVSKIEGSKVTVTKADGTEVVQDCLPGATIVVEVGEKLAEGDPLTTNPNVGGFGQEEKDINLQDMNRIYAYCALATSIFFAQLSFVLKKKQFEKVQLAEGF
jgi:apocytochrome f